MVFFDVAAFQPRGDFVQPFLRQDADAAVAEGDVVLFFQDGFLQVFEADVLVAKADGQLQVEPVDAAGGAAFDGRAVEVVGVFDVFQAEQFDVRCVQGVGGVQQPLVFDEFERVELVGGAVGECRVQRAYGVGEAGFKRFVARALQVVAIGGGL